jgi:transposase-like protein
MKEDSYYKILGIRLETMKTFFWEGLFYNMKERDLRGIKLIASCGHKEIQKAVR